MSDEAVVRIVLDDGGGANNPPATSQPAPTPAPSSASPPPPSAGAVPVPDPAKGMARFYHGAASGTPGDWLSPDLAYAQGYAGKGGAAGKVFYTDIPEDHPSLSKAYDDTGSSQKAPYNSFQAPPEIASGLKPFEPTPPPPPPQPVAPPKPLAPLVTAPTATTPPAPPAPTDQGAQLPGDSGTGISDPATFASPRTLERLAREAKQKEYLELAKKRVEREETLAAVDAEYAKLKPPPPPKPDPPFDPVALAKKRVEAENQRAAVDAEYAKLKPKAQKSTFDAILETAEDFRGIIGGTFGRVAGVALDIAARLRDARSKAAPADVPTPTATPTTATTPTAAVAPPIPSAVAAPGGGTPGPVAALAPPIPAAVPTGGVGGVQGAVAATAQLAGASSSAALSMASIVPVAGAVAVGFMAVVGAFNAAVAEINKMADKAGEYSPEVAQAQAMAEIRAMMGDMRRARENSKELAEFVRAQSEMQQRYEDLKVAIMSKIIPVVTGIMEVLSSLLGIASQTDVEEKDDPTFAILGGKVGGLGSDEMIPRF